MTSTIKPLRFCVTIVYCFYTVTKPIVIAVFIKFLRAKSVVAWREQRRVTSSLIPTDLCLHRLMLCIVGTTVLWLLSLWFLREADDKQPSERLENQSSKTNSAPLPGTQVPFSYSLQARRFHTRPLTARTCCHLGKWGGEGLQHSGCVSATAVNPASPPAPLPPL